MGPGREALHTQEDTYHTKAMTVVQLGVSSPSKISLPLYMRSNVFVYNSTSQPTQGGRVPELVW